MDGEAALTGKHAVIFGYKTRKRQLTGKTTANFGHMRLFGQFHYF
jgi:hypothetical protein